MSTHNDERLRIAYICADPGVPVFGAKGCSIHVQEVIRAMCRCGIAIDTRPLRSVSIHEQAPRQSVRAHPIFPRDVGRPDGVFHHAPAHRR